MDPRNDSPSGGFEKDGGDSYGGKFLKITLAIIVIILAVIILKLAKAVIFPFILAVFVSYFLDPPLELMARWKIPKAISVSVLLALAFVIIYLLGVAVYYGGKTFADSLPEYGPRVAELSRKLTDAVKSVLPSAPSAGILDVQKIAGWIGRGLGPFIGYIIKFLLVFLFTFFIVLGRGRGLEKLREILPSDTSGKFVTAINEVNRQVRKYLFIKTAMGILNGLEVWLVLEIFRVDFAPFFGLMAFVLNYIPNIGSLIATILRVAFAYFQFGNFWVPFWVLVITTGIDTLMSNIIEPRVMGSGLGLSPLLIIFSLVFWGWLWGISGMIIAVPVAALMKIIFRNVPGLERAALMLE